MRIRRVSAFRIELPLREGSYRWSGGKSVEVFDSTVVRLECDDGRVGWGEVCPLGAAYLPSYPAGARAGIAELAPVLLGEDPREPERLWRRMDRALKGHPYAKSALDLAAWDLCGQAAGVPVCSLLGGRYGEDVELYRAISQDEPARMAERVAGYRAEGYRRFQLKVGGAVEDDIARIRACAAALESGDVLVADANTGWLPHQALRVVRAVADVDVYVEQPCASYENCLRVRRATSHPLVLDETIDGLEPLLRAHADGALDVVNLKLSKLGGLTPARRLRDVCVELGIAMTLEDTWGGDVVTAAIAHLAHSTPEELRFSATDFNSYVSQSFADGAPERRDGRMRAASEPGLGVHPRAAELGPPCFDLSG